ncbi:MAG TPA: YraN family protein [Patescibacteria group bacterium]|nr:YraN family protein [Patescibacteria group bacterium]
MTFHVANPVGKRGEDIAAHFIHSKGYSVVEMNFRKNYTEIDIIATKDNVLVFFEVKTRISGEYGTPFEAITKAKIQNLVKTASLYQSTHPKLPQQMRIDAIGVVLDKDKSVVDIEHVENISGF